MVSIAFLVHMDSISENLVREGLKGQEERLNVTPFTLRLRFRITMLMFVGVTGFINPIVF